MGAGCDEAYGSAAAGAEAVDAEAANAEVTRVYRASAILDASESYEEQR